MIQFNDVTFYYKKNKPLFKNMTFDLESGKIYGLLGLNGAGKTTALKLMSGLLNPIDGNCTLNNETTFKRTPATLSSLFYISDEFYLPKDSVGSYEELYSPYYPEFSKEGFYKNLEEFGISKEDSIQNMSYGQKKKVLICFGIATNTSLLLLDEPTNGLDIPSKTIFRKLIASAASEEKCIIISTHQVLDVENLIDHFLIVNKGEMVLNKSLYELSEKFVFSALSGNESDESILYVKENQKGQKAILKNENDNESKIDIELLFNGVLNSEKILDEF